MERYKSIPQSECFVCPPFTTEDWSREQVAPLSPADGSKQPAIVEQPVPLPVVEPDMETQVSSAQIYPLPEADISTAEKCALIADQICAKIRGPYVLYDVHLARMHRRLKPPLSTEAFLLDELEGESSLPQEVIYPTGLGTLSFPELYERTRKYAAFVLYHTYQVSPGDIDDGLQAGYEHLWERLQQDPEVLKDKSMAWIGNGIVYPALHAIRHDWQYQKHIQVEEGRTSTDRRGTHSPESRQIDMRTDIHQAIREVASHILKEEKGKRADHDLWALYGLTMLQVSSSELSRLFHVREQSMHAAYNRVQKRLQAALPYYAPHDETKRIGKHGPDALPLQDMTAIRTANAVVSDELYGAVQTRIRMINADTRHQDELALEGIQQNVPISTQARTYGFPQYQMQRAYKRVHLMIAAERDPTVRTLRPERRMKYVFTLTRESASAVEQLAQNLLTQPKSFEKLVALHAHISNLAISTTAKHFSIPTSTLRYYTKQIGSHLQTPQHPARGPEAI